MTGRLRPTPATEIPSIEKSSAQSPAVLMRQMSPAEFNTAMVHFYRGEVQRSNTWRTRLDTTTYWAVLTTAGTLSVAFGSGGNSHFVILINSVLVTIFLLMEARRYRYYEIWSSRVRVLETGYFAQLLAPEGAVSEEAWAKHLAADLITPHFTISEWEAVGRRLRRNYLWLFALLALSWNLKVYLYPFPAASFDKFIDRAAVGLIPGWLVFVIGFVFNSTLLFFGIGTIRLREATGEILPQHQFSLRPLHTVRKWTQAATATTRRTTVRARRARQRVRTGAATGEFKRIDISETPDREQKSEIRSQRSDVRDQRTEIGG
jgi:uncharacterized membrane protein